MMLYMPGSCWVWRLLDRQFVKQAGAVRAVHVAGHLERLALLVQARVQDLDDGDAGGQGEDACFGWCRHTRCDLVPYAGHDVAEFFEPAVDPVLAGVGLGERCVLCLVPAEVRRDDLDGFVVGEVVVLPVQHAFVVGRDAEALGDVLGRAVPGDAHDVDTGLLALAFRFEPEGREAGLAVGSGVAVTAETEEPPRLAYEDTAPVTSRHQPLLGEESDCLAGRVAGGTVLLGEGAFDGSLSPGARCPALMAARSSSAMRLLGGGFGEGPGVVMTAA